MPVLDVVVDEERTRAELALKALASAGVDFARAQSHLVGEHGAVLRTNWAAVVEMDGERTALVQLAAGTVRNASPLEAFLGATPVELTLGTVDANWEITRVRSSPSSKAGSPAERAHMLHSARVGDILAARSAGSSPAKAPMASAATSPPAQARVGMTMAQCWVLA